MSDFEEKNKELLEALSEDPNQKPDKPETKRGTKTQLIEKINKVTDDCNIILQ